MNHQIQRTKAWGIAKGITGPAGSGTISAQAGKMMEEATETLVAAINYNIAPTPAALEELKDGIGDTIVTLTLLADMVGLEIEDCLDHALQVIEARTGTMKNGQFIKDL
jgi:NTP pyrophosphatase (non-canonical NTP hydrolase)